MKKNPNTGTIFDNYDTYVAFLRDASVTEAQLIELVAKVPYVSRSCRYATKHRNCTQAVLTEMRKSPIWFVRMVGFFHAKNGEDFVEEQARRINKERKEDKRVVNRAEEILGISYDLYLDSY